MQLKQSTSRANEYYDIQLPQLLLFAYMRPNVHDLSFPIKKIKTNEHVPVYPNRLHLLSHIPNYTSTTIYQSTHTEKHGHAPNTISLIAFSESRLGTLSSIGHA